MGVCQECGSCQYPRHGLFLAFGAFWVGGMNINKDDGFTLVEILIAITIFCFAVLGLAIGTVSVIRTNQTSHLRASAVNLAQARLEELRAMTSAAFSALSCPSSTPCSDNAVASGVTFRRCLGPVQCRPGNLQKAELPSRQAGASILAGGMHGIEAKQERHNLDARRGNAGP